MAKGRKKSTLSTTTDPKIEIQVRKANLEHELDKLQLICNTFASFSEEERYRNMSFFASKFSNYLPDNKS